MNKKNQIPIEEVKQIELGILDYIDSICRKESIPYILDFGTLLGAVRHKGFIPWDDDIDISLKRENYNRLINAIQNDNNPQYRVLTTDNDKHYHYEFAKVVDTRTQLQEDGLLESPNMGVWVDVFPYDFLGQEKSFIHFIIVFLRSIRVFAVSKKFPKHHNKLWYPFWVLGKITGPRLYTKAINNIIKSCCPKDSKFIGNLLSLSFNRKYCWEREIFEEITNTQFEKNLYPIPINYDRYLTDIYGNYMVLPPEDKRRVHHFSVGWRRNDN